MLKCCGCQTNFILSLGGSFLFSKNFLSTPSLTGGLVMPIRRTNRRKNERKYLRSFLRPFYDIVYSENSIRIILPVIEQNLNKLVKSGFLRKQGIGRGTTYTVK